MIVKTHRQKSACARQQSEQNAEQKTCFQIAITLGDKFIENEDELYCQTNDKRGESCFDCGRKYFAA